MATYDEILKQQQSEAEKVAAQAEKAAREKQDKLIAELDRQTQESKAAIQKEIDAVPQQYQKQYDANAVQELVNRRLLQERMANMNLGNSGLNRTQETAISVMKGNADAELSRQKQAAIDKLTQSITQLLSTADARKADITTQIADEIAKTRTGLLQSAQDNATKQYNAILDSQAKQAAEQAKLEQQRESGFYTIVQKYLENNPDKPIYRALSYAQSVSGYMPQSAQDTLKNEWSKIYIQYRNAGYGEGTAAIMANDEVYGMNAISTTSNPQQSQGELIRNFRALGG